MGVTILNSCLDKILDSRRIYLGAFRCWAQSMSLIAIFLGGRHFNKGSDDIFVGFTGQRTNQ